MAVSHQWFIQWSSPTMVFADISQSYHANQWEKSGLPYPRFHQNQKWKDLKRVSPKFQGVGNEWKEIVWPPVPSNVDPGPPPYVVPDHDSIPSFDDDEDPSRHPTTAPTPKDVKHKYNGNTHTTGLMLWLTVLGAARTQSMPADIDTPPFATLYKWKQIDFEFPSPRHRRHAITTGKYIPANVLPLGLEVWGSRVWVTLPSWRKGVPATLATVSRHGGVPSPSLKPYPNWLYHRAFSTDTNCTGLISVFRVNADPCGRLWVLDSGQIDSQDQPKQICPPSIVVFDLYTDTVLARYPIPKKYVLQDSLFANIIVDTRKSDCSDLHVYIADTWRFGLLVFRESDKKFWRFSHHLFYPDPLASNFTLHGINFQWADGIFGLALSPVDQFLERLLYFHSLSSYREFYVSTDVLKEPWRTNNSAMEFNLAGESRGLRGQASASAVDRRGVMYFGLVTKDSVGCWDTHKGYQKSTLDKIATDSETLVFPNDIKVDQEVDQSVWVISNRLPMFQAGTLDPDDYNYRILFADTREAVKGTICDPEVLITPQLTTLLLQRGML